MSVAFMFIGNALMMNLLIAMYKGIFDHVIEKADEEWKTEMYWLNHEFKGQHYFFARIVLLIFDSKSRFTIPLQNDLIM